MVSLPLLIEDNIYNYLTANYTGAYNLLKKFSIDDYELPAIAVGVSKLDEVDVNTGVYGGVLSLVILTQIDETVNDLSVHDQTVENIYELVFQDEAFMTYFNAQSTGHMWGLYDITMDQDKQDRVVFSVIEVNFYAQLLAV